MSERQHPSQSERGLQILRWVARRTEQRPVNDQGWVVYAIPHDTDTGARWEWDDYKPLVAAGLLDRHEDWKNVYVKLTDAGWAALSAGALRS